MSSGSWIDLEAQKRAALKVLNDIQQAQAQAVGAEGGIDIHHPERSPGWRQYRHQEFPQLMYHPAKNDPVVEAQRAGIAQRNLYAKEPLPIPDQKPLTRKVSNQDELELAEREGFVAGPKALRRILELHEANNPFAQTAKMDPLADEETAAQFITKRKR